MSLKRPKAPVAKWSQAQAARWIRSQVKEGACRITYHSGSESGPKRNISDEDAINAIKLAQRTINWEPGEIPRTREPTMTLRFVHTLKTRTIEVVTSIVDDDDDVIVVTVMGKPNQ